MTTNDRTAIINDRYEIYRRIGRGGMADVFLGRDRMLDRQVAVKVLFPEFAVDPNFVERFRREAQAAANLSHPNIVNVYDWGKHSTTYFIAMEYVEGRTLADILRSNGHVTSKQAAEIASEVAAALGFAHEAGLVHRDIKPANILIGSNGQVKVADFGIARAMNAPTESNLTQAGAVMGTATYFSPEQAQGAQPDPRSDLYSLGIVMYEMIAGRPPFTGENPVAIAYKQVHDRPQPLNKLVADVPRPFEAIVAKLLTKDPKVRYPNAGALRDDLRRFRNGEPVLALAAAMSNRPPTGATAVINPTSAATIPMAATGRADTGATQVMGPTDRPPARDGSPTGSSADANYYEPKPSRTGWYALAAFFALVALGVGALLLFNALSGDDETGARTLDDYVGMPLDEAVAALRAIDLPIQTIDEEVSTVPQGAVHRTDPVAGTVVVEGQVITLFYRPEPALRELPDVRGQQVETARGNLAAAGFTVGTETAEASDQFDEGEVIRTDPAHGTQQRQGTTVNLTVSTGPERNAIPSQVIGMTEAAARSLLEGEPYGFDVTVRYVSTSAYPAGQVADVDPAVGQLVAVGDRVTLLVSEAGSVQVPDVRWMTEAAARDVLGSAFNVSVATRRLPFGDDNDGIVLSQSLSPGAMVEPGTNITIEVGDAANTAPTTAAPRPTTTAPRATTTIAATTTTVTTDGP
ncbi:MAG: Stk1 family PASTA domain-containing Ser/Thr kinase [Desertimonas sp.]